MKETGIIMSGNHPKLILDGIKTMTRRVIVPQPTCHCDKPDWHGQIIDWIDYKYEGRQGWFCYTCGNGLKAIDEFSAHGIICPYGQVGDRLWVRETWAVDKLWDDKKPSEIYPNVSVWYATEYRGAWVGRTRSSRFMPRWASRILLEITEVRAERVQKISVEDIRREGIHDLGLIPVKTAMLITNTNNLDDLQMELGRAEFASLWDSLNAKRGYGWETNPWVFPIGFRKI